MRTAKANNVWSRKPFYYQKVKEENKIEIESNCELGKGMHEHRQPKAIDNMNKGTIEQINVDKDKKKDSELRIKDYLNEARK